MDFNFLKESFGDEEPKVLISYWLRRIFLYDWVMKLVALLITFTLWLGVTGLQKQITRPINNVPLNLIITKDLEITNSVAEEVNIELTGDKRKVDAINARDLVASSDLTDLQAGERTIQLTPQGITIDLPNGVMITKVLPEKIAVKLEKVEEYEVPVQIETEGNLAAGYEVYSKRTTPEKVLVRGPKSFVESLNFISTEKVTLKDRKSDFTLQKVPLNASNAKVTLVNSPTVNVFFRIGKVRTERLLVVPYATETRAGKASVLLFGPKSILENLAPEDLYISEEKEEDGTSKLRLILPEEIQPRVEIRSVKFRE